MSKLEDRAYLGDGVYAKFDGFHIWLWTLSGDRVALEPEVLTALDTYRRWIDDHYEVHRYAPSVPEPDPCS